MPTVVTKPFTVAAISFNPELFELQRNIAAAATMIEEAASNGAKVIVLPELSMSGSNYPDLKSWLPYMDTVPGKATDAFAQITKAHGCYVSFGVAEVDPSTGMTYNAAALVGPDGYVGKYRKTGTNMADITTFRPGNAGYPAPRAMSMRTQSGSKAATWSRASGTLVAASTAKPSAVSTLSSRVEVNGSSSTRRSRRRKGACTSRALTMT